MIYALSSCHNFFRRWTVAWEYKPNTPLPLLVAFSCDETGRGAEGSLSWVILFLTDNKDRN